MKVELSVIGNWAAPQSEVVTPPVSVRLTGKRQEEFVTESQAARITKRTQELICFQQNSVRRR